MEENNDEQPLSDDDIRGQPGLFVCPECTVLQAFNDFDVLNSTAIYPIERAKDVIVHRWPDFEQEDVPHYNQMLDPVCSKGNWICRLDDVFQQKQVALYYATLSVIYFKIVSQLTKFLQTFMVTTQTSYPEMTIENFDRGSLTSELIQGRIEAGVGLEGYPVLYLDNLLHSFRICNFFPPDVDNSIVGDIPVSTCWLNIEVILLALHISSLPSHGKHSRELEDTVFYTTVLSTLFFNIDSKGTKAKLLDDVIQTLLYLENG